MSKKIRDISPTYLITLVLPLSFEDNGAEVAKTGYDTFLIECWRLRAMHSISDLSPKPAYAKAFISYSPEDKAYLHELKKHLAHYERKYGIDIWDYTKIMPGSIQQEEIGSALQSAKVAVLLVSVNFRASDFIANHVLPPLLTAARQKSVTIIAVFLSYCAPFEEDELALFHCANTLDCPLTAMMQAEQDKIWTDVAKYVWETITKHTSIIREYSPGQHEILKTVANQFLHFRHMRDKQSREQVLSKLPLEIFQGIEATPILSNDYDADFTEVFNLVKVCSSYPDGLETLAYALYQIEPESLQWPTLDRLVREIGAKFITYMKLQQLHNILTNVKWPEHILKRAYRSSVPHGWDTLHQYDVPNIILLILEDLAKIPLKIPFQSNETFPILEFALHLANYARQQPWASLYDDLRNWINERAIDAGLSLEQLASLREKIKEEQILAPFYLLIILDETSENTFSVQARLLDSENNSIQDAGIEVSDEPLSLESIPALLTTLLESCEEYLSKDMQHLVIEFFLPQKYLSYPVDRWPLDMDIPISLYYQVVVRSLERAQNPKMRYLWEEKWKTVLNIINKEKQLIDHKDTMWIYNEDQYKTLAGLAAALQGSSVICLALAFVPQSVSPHGNSVFNVALRTGVPIVLWPRERTNHPMPLHDLLTTLVSPQSLSQLPALIQQQRIEAIKSENESHQGHYLTLLWDDPNRRLPDMTTKQLKMPVKRGA